MSCASVFAQCSSKDEILDGEKVQTFVPKMPTYEGGLKQFVIDFSTNLQLSDSDKQKISSQVHVFFIVDKSGQIKNLCVTNNESGIYGPVDISFDSNALMSKINKWSAGELDGKKVHVKMTFPISFLLQHPR